MKCYYLPKVVWLDMVARPIQTVIPSKLCRTTANKLGKALLGDVVAMEMIIFADSHPQSCSITDRASFGTLFQLTHGHYGNDNMTHKDHSFPKNSEEIPFILIVL